MGRGRAKAKQTKVARALKYGGPQTDFDRLAQELHATKPATSYVPEQAEDDEEDLAAIYSKYLDDEDDADDDSDDDSDEDTSDEDESDSSEQAR